MAEWGGKRTLPSAQFCLSYGGRVMNSICFAPLVVAVDLALASQALACRSPPEPSELVGVEADAIILAQITNVEANTEPRWRQWVATATKTRNVFGSPAQDEFRFADTGPGSCGPGRPSLGAHWILYLKKEGRAFRVREAWPFWWARSSMDSRLQRLSAMLPLGLVRAPTAEESTTLDAAERMMYEAMQGKEPAKREKFAHVPSEVTDLSRYTRVYSRSSARLLSVEMFRSKTAQRLVSDIREQGPTEASCKCKLYHGVIDFDEGDLRSWGRATASGD